MLGIKNTKKTSVLNGIGIALLLCALMTLMPMAGYVTNDVDVDLVATNDTTEGEFPALPDSKETLNEYEYEPSDELIGMRDQTTKTYVLEDGKYAQLTHDSPVHYIADSGEWTDINTNVVATPYGWEVTENTFSSYFAPEVGNGVSIQVNEFVDPIFMGIQPMLVTFDESATYPSQYMAEESNDEISVGGNMIRYPLADGFAIDYTVESQQLKQNLIVSERPVLDESQAWFGFTEKMILPEGYALFVGEEMIGEDVVITQESIDIRNIASGELLAEMPVPIVLELDSNSENPPYIATYIVHVMDGEIIISTVVESEWILSDDRVFPLAIDPTVRVSRTPGGYCYKYWNRCYVNTTYGVTRNGRYGNTKDYMMYSRFTYTSANGMPTGATVDSISHHQYVNYRTGSRASNSVAATVLEWCGSAYSYRSWSMPAAMSGGCSGALSPSRYSFTGYQSNSWNARILINSLWNSATFDTITPGTGWKVASVCNSASSCSSSSAASKILAAQSGTTSVGIGYKVPGNIGYMVLQGYNSGSYNSYINIVYSGGTDTDAPTSGFIPYTGVTSYIEGSRTFFTSLSDFSGVDTTSANKPTLNYALNNGSFTSVGATSIGTCSSTTQTCRFKAVIPSVSAGDYVEYYWKYQDLASSGANVGYDPALSGAQSTPTPYFFAVEDESDAGFDKKLTVLTTDVYAGGSRTPPSSGYFDRQFTHFNVSNEFYFEFDVSTCGSGSSGCFYSSNYYRYGNWAMQHATGAGTGYNGMASSNQRQHLERLHYSDGGYLTISATNGPGMNLLYHYNTAEKEFAMVGIGSAPSIDAPLSGGKSARTGYQGTYYSNWIVDFGTSGNTVDHGGMMGEFGFGNVTTSKTDANRLCVGSSGFTYFWRSTGSSRNACSASYSYTTAYGGGPTSSVWSGWALGTSYYGRSSTTTTVTYDSTYVKPMPDTSAPDIVHLPMGDSYSKTRVVSAVISDAGEPASGLNVSTTAGVGPTMYFRVTPDGGTTGAWNATLMTQESGKTRAQCILTECTWSADIEDLETNDDVEYYITAQDVSPVASGVNTATTSNANFAVGDPTTMFVVEWREMMYTTAAYTCTYQAIFYDVTNEIEFRYDNACRNYRDAGTVGFMDQTKTKGQTIRQSSSTQNLYGANPHTNNYRITTSSTGDGSWEAFERGTIPMVNADVSAIIGSSNGYPRGYDCSSTRFTLTSSAACADNIPMPNGFNFTYFGTDYNFTDTNDRIHLSRHGNMHFISNGAQSTVRTMSTWGTNVPTLPESSSSFARAGLIAPYWSYYGTYYCYQSQTQDCGVYYRTMPFEGKGTDVSADITTDTTWDITDSPIRINPTNDYLAISANMTIEAGTVIQVAPGKGISFDGACDQMSVLGNSTHHVRFEGQSDAEWKGMAFTGACSTGTDDRHVFTYVDFKNTTDAAIAAGSRHGSSPVSNSNVGNFTMDHVTYENVGTAFSHGSGRGTVVSMNEFQVTGADNSCFDFAQDTIATMTEGTITNCNTNGGGTAGAIVNIAGSTAGSLFLENVTITNSYKNLISVDFASVTLSNVTSAATTLQPGTALNLDGGNGAEVYIYNFDAGDYTSAGIDATGVINMTDVDLGDASLELYPAGSQSSNVASASGDNAIFNNVDAGDMTMRNIQPGLFTDVSVGDFKITGDPAVATDQVNFVNLNAEEVVMEDGCGWSARFDSMTADLFASVGCSASRSRIVIADSSIGHTSATQSVLYALNSDITVGETTITSTVTLGTNNIYLAQVDTNSNIRLVDVTQNGDACADASGSTGDCNVDVASSSSEIWYGGLATVRTFRVALVAGVPTNIYKGDHTVTAAVVDSSELFEVGTHQTSTATATLGSTSVWVITGNEDDGDTFNDHNIRAFGSAGQNETLTSSSWYPTTGFTIGSTIDLLLQPAPVDFDGANMDCAWLDAYRDADTNAPLPTNGTTASGQNIYEFDGTSVTVSADLTLDGCAIILKGSNMKVKSTATSSPIVTLIDNGMIIVSVSGDTGDVGAISAISPAYGLNLNIVKGTLDLDGGILQNVAQDATTGAALLIGPDATLIMSNNAVVYGSSATADDMATVKINGGSVNIADSSIINNGKTGTALWMQNTVGTVSNVIVKNAAVGIQSYNGAPQVDGFTATDNTVGLDVYGGMSLPTLYRSTLLSGQSAGWATHEIDLSGFLSEDFLQVGWNSIYGGGNAHPRYNYRTTKYYMMTDRYNIQLTDDANPPNVWNITDGNHIGYYPYSAADPRSGDGTHATYAAGATGGIPSWDCNTRGYFYGPNYPSSFKGYFPYINQRFTGSYGSYPGYYYGPTEQFGFDWENIEDVTPSGGYGARYPVMEMGYYYTSYHAQYNSNFYPPEGFQGSYNVCMNSASTYYMSSGQGARMTMPTIDLTASNLSKVTLFMDVLHNRADNFQDRLEFVARGGSNPAALGDYVRESGTPNFNSGVINGADTGISVGGGFAAANFDGITINNPVDSGLEVSGQVASFANDITVNGGTYGVLIGNLASGKMGLTNLSIDGATTAGVYYTKNMAGDLSGTVTNAGSAFKYGPNTDDDVSFSDMSISGNAIGIDSAGQGNIVLTDVTLSNTKDARITGQGDIDVIDGSVDASTVEVTGTGTFTRLRAIDVTITADGNPISDSTVSLVSPAGSTTGSSVTNTTGVASGLTFPITKVDSSGLTSPSIVGYKAISVAKVAYSYTSSTNNIADFRYASQIVTLADAVDNIATVPLTTRIHERVCFTSTSTQFTTVATCAGSYFSYSTSRQLSDGNGGTVTESGYFAGLAYSNRQNEVLMLDTPYLYWKGNGGVFNMTGGTILATGAYNQYDTQRWYARYPYGTQMVLDDASVFGVTPNAEEGGMYGVHIGWYQYPITHFQANNTTFSNLASIELENGYTYGTSTYYWEMKEVSITNSTLSHYRSDKSSLIGAVDQTEQCITIGGGEESLIHNNVFENCLAGVVFSRSSYYTRHGSQIGAWNVTVSDNTFNNGGHQADIWMLGNGNSKNAQILNNEFNNAGSLSATSDNAAISVFQSTGNSGHSHKDLLIMGNTINAAQEGIYLSDVTNYRVTDNTINGVGDSSFEGINVVGGTGAIDNNTLVDTDGGIVVEESTQPTTQGNNLCFISGARYGYRYSASCTFTVQAGQPVDVNIAVDTWGYEASLEITKPGGAKDEWGRGTSFAFPSYRGTTTYNPLVTYNATGQYTLTARDSYGDGGIQVNVIESAITAPYTGPVIADNSISMSDPTRIAPNAVGLVFDECTNVVIQSARNTISVSDNALSMSNCDVIDDSSSFLGDGTSSTVGINADDANNDVLTLSGTTITGFSTGIHKTSGSLALAGGADITGADYGVYVDDVSVTAIDAAVNGGAAGTGLHVVDSDDVWVYPMNASGLVGMYVENTPFRWDGGTSTAVTSLQVVESEGSVENMTWPTTTTQIDAGSNSYITSIGNTIVASKLTVAASATIDEANLFSMNSTHLEATPTKPVAMLIQSTDGSRASYVSTSFQPESMSVDGSNDDWVGGNALDPSGYAMPGKMSGNDTNDMLVTYIEGDYLYIGLTGEDLAASDVLVYLNVGGAGTTTGYNLGGAHTLPIMADYVLWADDASNYALYSHGFLGWGQTSSSSGATVQVASTSGLTEIAIPFSQIGGTPSEIDIVTIVQGETTADVSTVHPTQNINALNTLQTFTDYITVELTKDDLVTGIIDDEVLVYRSYKGSNTASAAKNYDLMIKTKAACSHDWAVVENISLSTNVAFDDDYVTVSGDTTNVQDTLDIKRACPEIQPALDNITIDEDSGVYTFSLLNMADDEQDLESTLTWTSADRNLVSFDANADGADDEIISWNQNVQQFTITPLENQFGTMVFDFEVTDSNGLKDTKFINLVINNVNDAPIICNSERVNTDCMPIITVDDIYLNINSEGFDNVTQSLGSVANVGTSYISDQANEQVNRQAYDWDASVDSSCVAFTVNVSITNSLIIYENQSNEKGGTCTITLELSDDGPVNNTAVPFTVDYSVAPVNDAPEISLQDANGQNLIVSDAGTRAEGQGEFITMTEDDTNADNLTWDLLPLMSDIDHDVPSELTWEVESTSQCTYMNYFSTAIVGTELVFTLVPDATTNAKDWEQDFMNDNGVHQVRPNGQTFCAITLHLNDTIAPPVHTPNYDPSIMPIANYTKGSDSIVLYVTIDNVAEKVADYSLNTVTGVDFKGITNIMTGTEVPISVNIDAGGDEGPYTYDHMLAVTFFTDGHTDDQYTRTSYYNVPDYGQSLTVDEDVYMTKDTTRVEISMDVLTCLNNPCDLTVPSTERFQTDSPESHRANNGGVQGAEWSKPGQFGVNSTQTSERRPMLQDNYWCNNRLTTLSLDAAEASADWGKCNEFDAGQGSFGATNQTLPSVVRTIGASAVPSFAPSIVAVSLTGLFVSALAFSSRRADDEEEMLENTSIKDDDMAVSPVIATILMVAITVVLSGVIYVWASSLADTDVKGVPRVTFAIDDVNSFDADEGHWRITVQSSETDLATQAVEVRVFYVDASGEAQVVTVNLASVNDVYGFNPANSDSMVTFVDQVNSEGDDRVSTFNTGDTVFVRTHDSAGTPLEDVTITINYAPNVGQGAQLRTWQGLSYDVSA